FQRLLPIVSWCGRQLLWAGRQAVRLFLSLPRKAQIGVAAGLAILISLIVLLGMVGAFSNNKDATIAARDTRPADQPPSTEPRERLSAVENGQLIKTVRDKVERATVRIIVRRSNGDGGSGSGFFALQKGIILTNAHVVGML